MKMIEAGDHLIQVEQGQSKDTTLLIPFFSASANIYRQPLDEVRASGRASLDVISLHRLHVMAFTIAFLSILATLYVCSISLPPTRNCFVDSQIQV